MARSKSMRVSDKNLSILKKIKDEKKLISVDAALEFIFSKKMICRILKEFGIDDPKCE